MIVRSRGAVCALALGCAVIVAATAQTPAPRKQPVQLRMVAENGSSEAGTATLYDGVKGLIVKLRLSDPTAPIQPAHIHKGTCDKLDPKPLYPLNAVRDGKSETTIADVTIAQLQKAPFAINVHKSPTEAAIYVSCGNLSAPK